MANDTDLFEVLKDNIKILDLNKNIQEQKDKVMYFIDPYLSQDQKQWMSKTNHFIEPDWPAGQKRTLHKKYEQMTNKLWSLERIRGTIIDKVYPGYDEEFEFDYAVEIKVTRYKNKEAQE